MSKKTVGIIIGVIIAIIVIGVGAYLALHHAAKKVTPVKPTKPSISPAQLAKIEFMKFGNLHAWTVEWNPWNIAVNAWIYDYDVLSLVGGNAVVRNPLTGDVVPFQCKFKVIRGPLKINGYAWNGKLMKWVKVNGTALNAVVFNCKLGVWQDNQTETLWDIIYEYYLNWEWAKKWTSNQTFYDPVYASLVAPTFFPIIKAINIINKTTFIVYVNYTHPYYGKIVMNAILWPSLPWPEVYAIELAAASGKVAVTDQTASTKKVPCIDLKDYGSVETYLVPELEKLAKEGAIPPAIKNAPESWKKILGTVTPSEASKYYDLVLKFINTYHHGWIGDGYYMIVHVYFHQRKVELKVWPKYPIHGKAFDYILNTIMHLNVTPVPDDIWKYKTIIIEAVPRPEAVSEVTSGILTGYLFSLSPTEAATLITKGYSKWLKVYPLGNGYVDLLFNPAPPDANAKANGIYCNPFEYAKVRFAFNYLVDRNYIVKHIYLGYAEPLYFIGIPPQYKADYEILEPIIYKLDLSYNWQKGWKMIYDTLKAHGYIYKNGKWYCPLNDTGGKLVPVKIIVARRIEDQRSEIGSYVESILKKLGFEVIDKPITGEQAYTMVYGSNPADMKWMIYTEGWIDVEIEKYHDENPFSFCAMYSLMPGWGTPGYWQYNASKVYIPELHMSLYKATLDLEKGKFKSLQQRRELFYWSTYYCTLQAVRVWLAALKGIYIVNPKVSGLVPNLFGFWHTLNMLHVYVTPT